MSGILLLGLAAVAGAIGLGWAAAMTRPKTATVDQRLASIESFYAVDVGGEGGSGLLPAPLSGPMVGLRA